MKVNGIRISDEKNEFQCIDLQLILKEIQYGDKLYWSILYFYGEGKLANKSISDFDKEIKESERGLVLTWEELRSLSNHFKQIFDILIIGCQNISLLYRYEEDQEMYEACDIVIEMIDGGFWQVFSKNPELINKLSLKFKDIEFLESDFQKDFYK